MDTRELGSQFAVVTALGKALKRKDGELRRELDERFMELRAESGMNSMELSVGTETVGKLYVRKPTVEVVDPVAYEDWARQKSHYQNLLGETQILVTVSHGETDEEFERAEDMIEGLEELAKEHGAELDWVSEPDPNIRRSLEVHGDYVIYPKTGEVVPGCAVKPGKTAYSGCQPADVAQAMGLLGEAPTINGLLEEA